MPEYYLIDCDGDKRNKVKALSTDEVKQITDACAAIYEFYYLDRRFLEINLNYEEFTEVYKSSTALAVGLSESELRDSHYNRIFVNINRTFSNYISSYKLFVDHFDQRLKSKYSETSTEYIRFKKHKNNVYDNNLAYKLLYYLRNFSEHSDFPINHIQTDTDYSTGSPKKTFVLSFDKTQLLKNATIRKKLALDLRSFGNLFPAMPYITKTLSLLPGFYKVYLEIEKDFLFDNIRILEGYLIHLKYSPEPAFGYIVSTGRTSAAVYTTLFPVDVISKLKEIFEVMVNGN